MSKNCSGLKSPISKGQFQCYSILVAVTKYDSEEIPDVTNGAAIFMGVQGLLPPLKDACLGLFLENEELEGNGCLSVMYYEQEVRALCFHFYTKTVCLRSHLSSWHDVQRLNLESGAQSLAVSLNVI